MISCGYTAHQWVSVGDCRDPDILWNISFIIQGEKSVSQAAFNFRVFVDVVASKRFSSLPVTSKRYQVGFGISDTMSFFAPDVGSIIYWHIKQSVEELEKSFNADTMNHAHFDSAGIAKELALVAVNQVAGRRYVPPPPAQPIPELERMLEYA